MKLIIIIKFLCYVMLCYVIYYNYYLNTSISSFANLTLIS